MTRFESLLTIICEEAGEIVRAEYAGAREGHRSLEKMEGASLKEQAFKKMS